MLCEPISSSISQKGRFPWKLLKGVMRVASDKPNPIKGNLVAGRLREVIGHVSCIALRPTKTSGIARNCVWCQQAADTSTVTRRQRANYIVHPGLPNTFVEDTLKFDVRQFVQPLLDASDALSKATDVRTETIAHKGREVRAMIQEVLLGLLSLQNAAAASRDELKHVIAGLIFYTVFDSPILRLSCLHLRLVFC